MRRGRLKARNDPRKAKAFARNYGEESDLVRLMDCAVPGCRAGPIECAHDPARGAGGCGGGRFDQGPLCKPHHAEQTNGGIKSFQAKYGIDLRTLWDEIALGHERPLGLRTVAARWCTVHPLTDYERDALIGWVRRASHRGLDVAAVQAALDLESVDESQRLVDLAA